MKKFFPLILLSVALLAGCEKPETGVTFPFYDPKIVIDNPKDLNIAAEGGPCTLRYNVVNPILDGRTSAAAQAPWIHSIDCSHYKEIRFTAEPNPAPQRSRSQILTLTYTYGEQKTVQKEVTVTQAAAGKASTKKAAADITSTDKAPADKAPADIASTDKSSREASAESL